MVNTSESTGIIVLGMHRSGTSLLTKTLAMAGAWLGEEEKVSAKGEDNPTGFWEHISIRKINDCLLETAGSSWDAILDFSLQNVPAAINQDLFDEASSVIASLRKHPLWAIKDPRLSFTLPWWRPLLGNAIVVYSNRSPLDIARSLQRRNGFSIDIGIALWEAYTISAAKVAQSLPAIVIDYDDLVERPVETQEYIAREISKHTSTELAEVPNEDLLGFVSKQLRHSNSDPEKTNSALNDHQRTLFDSVREGNLDAVGNQDLSETAAEVLNRHAHRALQSSSHSQETFNTMRETLARLFQVATILRDQAGRGDSELAAIGQKLDSDPTPENVRALMDIVAVIKDRLQADSTAESLVALRDSVAGLMNRVDADRTPENILALQDSVDKLNRRSTSFASNEQIQILTDLVKQLIASMQSTRVDSEIESLRLEISEVGRSHRESEKLHAEIRSLDKSCSEMVNRITEYEREIERLEAENHLLLGWMRNLRALTGATFDSARWKLGNRFVRGIELALFRKRPALAADTIMDIAAQFESIEPSLGKRTVFSPIENADRSATKALREVPVTRAEFSEKTFDFILFPVIDWHFRIQRPQHLAREIASQGHRVFYLNLKPVLNATEPGFEISEEPEPGVLLISLEIPSSTFPNVYNEQLTNSITEQLLAALSKLIRKYSISNPVSLVNLPFWRPVAQRLPGTPLVYDCMDHHGGFSTATAEVEKAENALVNAADLLIVTSNWLKDRFEHTQRQHLIPNAGEIDFFSRRPEQLIPFDRSPVVGYIGAIADWFDVELVAKLASMRPGILFVLVGSTAFCDTSKLKKFDNIKLIGEIPYKEVPRYLHAFDCCFIPFRLTDLIKATNPVKIYEYLAAGKPVVSTRLPELESIGDLIHIADDPEEFAQLIDKGVKESADRKLSEKRSKWASRHDWSTRGKSFVREVQGLFPRISVIVLCYNNLEFTKTCIKSLRGPGAYPNMELVIVDNGSSDGTPEYLAALGQDIEDIRIVLNEQNLGFAAGNNRGIEASTGEYIILLNNDTYTTPGWAYGLIRHLIRNPRLGLVSPVTNNIGNEAKIDINYADMDAMLEEAFKYTSSHPQTLLPVPIVAFFCVAMHRRIIDEVGLLDEQFGQGFFEDDDYCRRVIQAGYEIAIAEDVFVHHHLSATFGKEDDAKKMELFESNRRKYEAKWGKWKPHEYRR